MKNTITKTQVSTGVGIAHVSLLINNHTWVYVNIDLRNNGVIDCTFTEGHECYDMIVSEAKKLAA